MMMKKFPKIALLAILSLLTLSKAEAVARTVTRDIQGIRTGEYKTSDANFLSYAAYARDRYTKKLAYTGDSSRDYLYSISRYSY